MKKVMFISSTGGHFAELLKINKIFNNYNYVIVTEKTFLAKRFEDKYKIEYLMNGERSKPLKYIFVVPINILKSIYLYIKYRPDLIYTTGAHTCVPLCIIGKIFKTKIIFVEVFDRITYPSLTAKIIYKLADTFIVQHKELQKKFKDSKYIGGVY